MLHDQQRLSVAIAASMAIVFLSVAWGGPSAAGGPQILREGTTVADELGAVVSAGGRLEFQAESGRRFILLENLGLQRVARAMAENPHATLWRVTGTATEFQGDNYLLLSRAIQKAAVTGEPSDAADRTARGAPGAADR